MSGFAVYINSAHFFEGVGMENLPETSQASIRKGFWFVFKDGETTIRIWGASLSGKEKIYVNDALVSESRSQKRNSEHQFKIVNDQYKLTINVLSMLKGPIECKLYKNGVLLKKQTCHHRTNNKVKRSNTGLAIAVGIILGISIVAFGWQYWIVYCSALAALAVTVGIIYTTWGSSFVFEVVNIQQGNIP